MTIRETVRVSLVAPTHEAGEFLITSGTGHCRIVHPTGTGIKIKKESVANLRFDNHAKLISTGV